MVLLVKVEVVVVVVVVLTVLVVILLAFQLIIVTCTSRIVAQSVVYKQKQISALV